MKVGIFYATMTGTTKKCAEILCKNIPGSALCELGKKEIYLEDYDYIIIGTPIIAGMFHKQVKKFIKTNRDKLLNKVGFFFCHGFAIDEKRILKTNVDNELLKGVSLASGFGGEIHLDKLRGFFKLIVKLATRSNKVPPQLNMQAIFDFINKLKAILEVEVKNEEIINRS